MSRSACLLVVLMACWLTGCTASAPDRLATRPNFLMVVFEDMSPRIGAYGDVVAQTPVLDNLAAQSITFTNAYTTAGVCAPSRSSLITGVHQQVLGTQHMRTRSPVPALPAGGPIEYDAVPPEGVKAFPELLRAAGYYTSNNGKTDYQFGEPFLIWDEQNAEHPWRNRPAVTPFFAMVNLMTTHESYVWPTEQASSDPLVELVRQRNLRDLAGKRAITDPAGVLVPPYLPDTPIVRADIARHYDNIAFTEQRLAELLRELEADGLAQDTIVIVTTDHGDGLPRMKRSLYDSGLHVPLFVRFPGTTSSDSEAGSERAELVSFVDIAPTILSLAGQPVPDYMQGRVFVGAARESAPEVVFAAMDRHDSVPDRLRAVRDKRFKYIRNYQRGHAFFRRLNFRDVQPSMAELWRGLAAGTLTPIQQALFNANRPAEELYDTHTDPHEVNNLALDAEFRVPLLRLRAAHEAFMAAMGDKSEIDEAQMIEAMWPGFVQPTTAAPSGKLVGKRLLLSSATPGASIGYRYEREESWRVYTGPFVTELGQTIEAKAVRYGYAESEVVTLPASTF
ncbi:MAG: sulfatase-like hydrolase/transferase [Pseudomonadaceae bacterium]|nr:sulfatase-like hydrolase/transferase [Pseudomonadaceae bacterium]